VNPPPPRIFRPPTAPQKIEGPAPDLVFRLDSYNAGPPAEAPDLFPVQCHKTRTGTNPPPWHLPPSEQTGAHSRFRPDGDPGFRRPPWPNGPPTTKRNTINKQYKTTGSPVTTNPGPGQRANSWLPSGPPGPGCPFPEDWKRGPSTSNPLLSFRLWPEPPPRTCTGFRNAHRVRWLGPPGAETTTKNWEFHQPMFTRLSPFRKFLRTMLWSPLLPNAPRKEKTRLFQNPVVGFFPGLFN